jgi:hypothetical protein
MIRFARVLLAPSLAVLLAFILMAVALQHASSAEDHVAHIDGIMHSAMAELDEVLVDEATPPLCRAYADRLYLLLHLLEEMQRRPHSTITGQAFGSLFQPVIEARSWCQEAI